MLAKDFDVYFAKQILHCQGGSPGQPIPPSAFPSGQTLPAPSPQPAMASLSRTAYGAPPPPARPCRRLGRRPLRVHPAEHRGRNEADLPRADRGGLHRGQRIAGTAKQRARAEVKAWKRNPPSMGIAMEPMPKELHETAVINVTITEHRVAAGQKQAFQQESRFDFNKQAFDFFHFLICFPLLEEQDTPPLKIGPKDLFFRLPGLVV